MWRDLTSTDPGHRVTRGGRRAARARLRRAATPLEVMFESEALRLIARLPHENPERVAILAGVWRSLINPTPRTSPAPSAAARSTMTNRPSCPKAAFAACCKPAAANSWTRCAALFV